MVNNLMNVQSTTFASINLRALGFGGNASSQIARLCDWMHAHEIDVLCCQEVTLQAEQVLEAQKKHPNFVMLTHAASDGFRRGGPRDDPGPPPPGPPPYGQGRRSDEQSLVSSKGIAILIRAESLRGPREGAAQVIYGDTEGRYMVAHVVLRDRAVNVANVYLPAHPERRRRYLSQMTPPPAEETGPHRPVPEAAQADIFCGDWNMVEAEIDRTSSKPPGKQDSDTLRNFLYRYGKDQGGFADGWREWYPTRREYTHRNSNQGQSRIDRIYIRRDWLTEAHRWKMIQPPDQLNLDHRAVTVQLKATIVQQRGPGRPRLRPTLLKNPRYIRQSQQALRTRSEPQALVGDPDLWEEYKTTILQSLQAQERAERRRRTKTRGRLYKRRDKLVQRRGPAHDPALEQEVAQVEAQMGAHETAEALRYHYNAMAKHHILGERPSKWFFQLMAEKQRTGTFIEGLGHGDYIETSPEGKLAAVNQFYTELLDEKPSDPEARHDFLQAITKKISRKHANQLKKPITTKEVEKAIRRGRNGASPGGDGIPVEFYKALMASEKRERPHQPPLIVEWLKGLFNRFLRGAPVPKTFTEGVLAILYKQKGRPTDLKNYRPLTVTNSDYRIFATILMTRLLRAINPVLGPEQTAFLPARLIDDNIWTVKTLIDRHKDPEQGGVGLLFLDQYKAYDRVSHEYLWAVLKHINVPDEYIQVVQALYQGAVITPYVNGYKGAPIPVRSGVRQGCPLSCPLYIIVMEGLVRTIARHPRIEGPRLADGTRVLATLYADDTVLMPKNQMEADILTQEILPRFEKATGGRINYEKTALLVIHAEIDVPQVIRLGEDECYTHLGIPVGKNTDQAEHEKLQSITNDMRKTVDTWLSTHLSLRGRCMIANTLVLSQIRYFLRFCSLTTMQIQEVEKIYYRMVWDGRVEGLINRDLTLLPRKDGGLGLQHIPSINKAAAIATFARMDHTPDLPWAAMVQEHLSGATGRTKTIYPEKVPFPWRQRIGTRKPIILPCLKRQWELYAREIGYSAPQPQEKTVIPSKHPQTAEEVWRNILWYNRLFKIKSGAGVRVYSTPIWRKVRSLADAPMTLGDAYEIRPDRQIAPRRLKSLNREDNENWCERLKSFWDTQIPDLWTEIIQTDLDQRLGAQPRPSNTSQNTPQEQGRRTPGGWEATAPSPARPPGTPVPPTHTDPPRTGGPAGPHRAPGPPGPPTPPDPRALPGPPGSQASSTYTEIPEVEEPIYNELRLRGRKGEIEWKYATYRGIYKALVDKYGEGITNRPQIEWARNAVQRRIHRQVSIATTWAAATDLEKTPKCGDLLWRLLHGRVRVGDKLPFLEIDKRMCPHCNTKYTLKHLWLECPIAKTVWREFKTIWRNIATENPMVPIEFDELVGFMAIPPDTDKAAALRWRIMYGEVVWTLWKYYLTHNFDERADYYPAAARRLYNRVITERVQTDRVLCLSPAYGDEKRHTPKMFARIWGEAPAGTRPGQPPRCTDTAGNSDPARESGQSTTSSETDSSDGGRDNLAP